MVTSETLVRNLGNERVMSLKDTLELMHRFVDENGLVGDIEGWLEQEAADRREEAEEEGRDEGRWWAEQHATPDELDRLTAMSRELWGGPGDYSVSLDEVVVTALLRGPDAAVVLLNGGELGQKGVTDRQVNQRWCKLLGLDPKRHREELYRQRSDESFVYGFVWDAVEAPRPVAALS